MGAGRPSGACRGVVMTEIAAHPPSVVLYWIPLGAGAHVVRRCGRAYETIVAAWQRRDRCDLYHAALEVHLDSDRYIIEMTPVWDRADPDRGVVSEGPVGLAWLGRWKWFRYEVRRWRNGLIPDASYAVDSPCTVSRDRDTARRLLESIAEFPPGLTWGRDAFGAGDMWNSNSLIAWLLTCSGHDIDAIVPPPRGRAPGWAAGVAAARQRTATQPLTTIGA